MGESEMGKYRIHPLVVGINETDQGILTYQKGYGKRVWLPIYVFYVEGGDVPILIDTGMEEFMVPPDAPAQTGLKIMDILIPNHEVEIGRKGIIPSDL